MNTLTCVCGTAGSGKTQVILGMLQLARKRGTPIGACKPVDVGDIDYQSQDQASAAEFFQETGGMSEHVSLINPYLLNESLPPQLAAERDGIAIDLKLLETQINDLGSLYPRILVEGPPGLLTPFVESRNWLETLQMWHPQLIWICGIGAEDLELSLLSLHLLQQSGLSVKILINNSKGCRDRELIQYQWLTLEEKAEASVLGFIPYFKNDLVSQMCSALDGMIEEPWPNLETS